MAGSTTAIVQCLPLPEWVDHHPYSDVVPGSKDSYIDNGVFRILYDSQTKLNDDGFSQHVRTIQRIVTRAGAEKAAHFAVEFDPTSQRVDVHFISVLRLGVHFNHAKSAVFQILRREKKLEQLALDGRLTATFLIPDLRVDDVLDVSLTVTSNNPIIGKQYASLFAFNALAPWVECRHRLRTPIHREIIQKLFCQPPASTVTKTHDAIDSIWSLTHQTRLEAEEFTPPWQIQVPAIQFSEYRTWNQVAEVFSAYYAPSEMPPDLAAKLTG